MCLGMEIGLPVTQNSLGHLLGHVCDHGDDPKNPATRIYRTAERQLFHTDSCDVVSEVLCSFAPRQHQFLFVTWMRVWSCSNACEGGLCMSRFCPMDMAVFDLPSLHAASVCRRWACSVCGRLNVVARHQSHRLLQYMSTSNAPHPITLPNLRESCTGTARERFHPDVSHGIQVCML